MLSGGAGEQLRPLLLSGCVCLLCIRYRPGAGFPPESAAAAPGAIHHPTEDSLRQGRRQRRLCVFEARRPPKSDRHHCHLPQQQRPDCQRLLVAGQLLLPSQAHPGLCRSWLVLLVVVDLALRNGVWCSLLAQCAGLLSCMRACSLMSSRLHASLDVMQQENIPSLDICCFGAPACRIDPKTCYCQGWSSRCPAQQLV